LRSSIVTHSSQSCGTFACTRSSPNTANFIDYVSGGLEIGVTVDFTGSNGDPRLEPRTILASTKNDYQWQSLLLLDPSHYDTDQMFRLRIRRQVRRRSPPLLSRGGKEEVHGVDGVPEAYHQASSLTSTRSVCLQKSSRQLQLGANSAQLKTAGSQVTPSH
jgi:hypothetical protein